MFDNTGNVTTFVTISFSRRTPPHIINAVHFGELKLTHSDNK